MFKLIVIASLSYIAAAQDSKAFLGRWNVVVTPAAGNPYPQWLELIEKEGKLEGRIQPRGGGWRPLTSAAMQSDKMIVAVGNVRWELTSPGTDKIAGIEMRGETTGPSLAGVRAPKLDRKMPKKWTKPVALFNGKDLTGWDGDAVNYEVVEGAIMCKKGKGGNLFTKEEFADFIATAEYKLPPGGNNGFAIRYPGKGQPSTIGMTELQVLDDTAEKYAKLDPRQFNGSAYGMAAATKGYLRPLGEWNYQVMTVKGSTIKVELNGTLILDTDLSKITEFKGKEAHPGKDLKSGHFGFAGHGDAVAFRNLKIQVLK